MKYRCIFKIFDGPEENLNREIVSSFYKEDLPFLPRKNDAITYNGMDYNVEDVRWDMDSVPMRIIVICY